MDFLARLSSNTSEVNARLRWNGENQPISRTIEGATSKLTSGC